jgi:glycosyltransferase involved in cell wall biosynthesis
MKITIVTPFFTNKDSRAKRFASELTRIGHQVTIVSTELELKSENNFFARLKRRLLRYTKAIKIITNIQGGLIAVNSEIALIAHTLRYLGIAKHLEFIAIDVYDHHGYIFTGIMAAIFSRIERMAVLRADAVIIPIPERLEQYNPKIPPKALNKIHFISNLGFDDLKAPSPITSYHSEAIKLVYAGTIDAGRGILSLAKCAQQYPEKIKLDIYGSGPHLMEFANSKEFRAHYRGQFNFIDLERIYCNANFICGFYELNIPNHQYCDPNKLREIFEFEKPIITNKGTPLSAHVERMSIGLVVSDTSPESIFKAITECKATHAQLTRMIEDNRITVAALIDANRSAAAALISAFE